MPATSTRLHSSTLIPALALLAATACGGGDAAPDDEARAITSSARLYEGARLIAGNGGEPIEDAAFLVDDGVIVAVGRSGELGLPLGAGRVDLADKTVMPMLVGLHGHPGYQQGLSGRFKRSSQHLNGEELRWEHRNVVGHPGLERAQ